MPDTNWYNYDHHSKKKTWNRNTYHPRWRTLYHLWHNTSFLSKIKCWHQCILTLHQILIKKFSHIKRNNDCLTYLNWRNSFNDLVTQHDCPWFRSTQPRLKPNFLWNSVWDDSRIVSQTRLNKPNRLQQMHKDWIVLGTKLPKNPQNLETWTATMSG